MRFRELRLRRDPHRAQVTELIDYEQFCGVTGPGHTHAPEGFTRITARELHERRAAGWRPYVLDVRKPHEAEIVSLPFTDRLEPHETVARIAGELPRDRDIVVSCKSGTRSVRAAETLAALGFRRLFHLDDGIVGWARDVDPTLPTY
jgi:adenylyltransferase/sulfurtransferase